MDVKGDHTMNCRNGGDRIIRHNLIRDKLDSLATTAGLSPRKEVLDLIPGSSRPADVLVPCFDRGMRDVCYDVTVVNPLQDMYREKAGPEPGAALVGATQRKNIKHAKKCDDRGLAFQPLAFESLGGWDLGAVAHLKKIARAIARRDGQEEDTAHRHTLQQMSVALMRGNGAMFVNRRDSSGMVDWEGVI